MNNRHRITLAAFLAYFLMSGMLAPIGIISAPMAAALEIPVTAATANFSWLTIGILIGAIIALFIFDLVALRGVVITVSGACLLALVSIRLRADAMTIRLALGVIGVACGIGLAAAASAISLCYAPRERASMLVVTDGAFSVAGIACAALASYVISHVWHWATTYVALAGIAAIIVMLAASSRYPAIDSADTEAQDEPWPAAVWCCVAALFLYTLGQYAMLWWLPNHLMAQGVSASDAGSVVGRFWSGMFAAQILVAWWVLRTGARRMALLAAAGALAGSVPMWLVDHYAWLPSLAAVWGFTNFGLLKVVLSFATQQVTTPSSRLVSLMLLGATSGTAISPWLSSQIVAVSDTMTVLRFASVCYLVMGVLLVIASGQDRTKGKEHE
ncbi:MAG: MFS transporter TsgA [Pseudomonadota bacterium]